MKRYLVACLFLITINVQAQYDSLVRNSIKLDVVNWFDTYPALMISYEHHIYKSLYLHHEGGWVIPLEDEQGNLMAGFKLREELRTYLTEGSKGAAYMALDIRYTYETIEDGIILGYNCEEGCQFYQFIEGTARKELLAFGFRFGYRHNFKRKTFLEYDMGYGIGKDFVSMPKHQIPEDFSSISVTNNPFNISDSGWKTVAAFRVKFGRYLFKDR